MAANHVIFFLFSAFSCFCCLLLTESKPVGFTVDLVHIDSPASPFYNPSTTQLSRHKNAMNRSFSRAALLSNQATFASLNSLQAPVFSARGEYVMEVSIGTPPLKIFAIVDTGSDLTWTQCKPCQRCFRQTTPLFDPSRSSSYRKVGCQTQICKSLIDTRCSSQLICEYSIWYADNSFSMGELATETFAFGSTSGRPTVVKMAFGCGFNNKDNFNKGESGIVGIGGGPLSIINQLDASVKGIFSYCFVPRDSPSNVSSKINFGSSGLVSGHGVVSTPLVSKDRITDYYLTLVAISVGHKRFTYKTSSSSESSDNKAVEKGINIIIDSGTTITFLPKTLFQEVVSELKEAISVSPVRDPGGLLELCYRRRDIAEVGAPAITAHFSGGANLVLPPSITFAAGVGDDVVCLGMASASWSRGSSVFGNLFQVNFLVGYDLVDRKVSFKPTDCTKH